MTQERRTLPHNIDAEASVLGGIILRNELLSLLDELELEDFYDYRHRVVFQAIRLLQTKMRPIDVVTLEVEIENTGKLDAVGGIAFLGELALRVPTADNVVTYAEQVHEHSITRKAMLALGDLLEEAYERSLAGSTLVAAIAATALAIRVTGDAPSNTMGSVISLEVAEVRSDMERRARGEKAYAGVPIGINLIDQKIGGVPRGVITYVIARPAMGKTLVAMHCCDVANQMGTPAMLCSYEDGPRSFAQRGAAQEANIDTGDIRSRRLTNEQLYELERHAARAVDTRTETFLYASGLTVEKLIARVRRENLKRKNLGKKPIGFVAVDYLGRMPMPSPKLGFNTRDQQIGFISASLATWAADDDIALMVFCQLNRETEKRPDSRPRLSDARDSGSIEQDGKFILGLHRPAYYDPKADPTELSFLVLKNHNGEQNIEIPTTIDLPTGRIFNSPLEYNRWRAERG